MVKLVEMKSLLQGIGSLSFEALAASDVAAMDERLKNCDHNTWRSRLGWKFRRDYSTPGLELSCPMSKVKCLTD